ncbi:hypothetical protein HMI56_002332 [Coelomomyces lativittatus]|nr:hypothetical protein HMI56_002332 [Coelomomyces lativittatus]
MCEIGSNKLQMEILVAFTTSKLDDKHDQNLKEVEEDADFLNNLTAPILKHDRLFSFFIATDRKWFLDQKKSVIFGRSFQFRKCMVDRVECPSLSDNSHSRAVREGVELTPSSSSKNGISVKRSKVELKRVVSKVTMKKIVPSDNLTKNASPIPAEQRSDKDPSIPPSIPEKTPPSSKDAKDEVIEILIEEHIFDSPPIVPNEGSDSIINDVSKNDASFLRSNGANRSKAILNRFIKFLINSQSVPIILFYLFILF